MSLNTEGNKEIYKKYAKDSKTESEINSLKNTGKQEKSLIRQLSVNLKNLALKRSGGQGESTISVERPSFNEDKIIEYIGFTPKQYKGGLYRQEMQLNMGNAETEAVFKLGSRAFKLKNRNTKLGEKTPKEGDSWEDRGEKGEYIIRKADLVVKKNELIPPLLHFLNYNMFAMRTPWRYLSKEKTLRNNVEELLLFLKLFQKLTTKYYKDIDFSGKTTREHEFEFMVNFYNYVYTKINILFKQMTYNEIVNTVLEDKEKKIAESEIDVNFLIGYKDVVCINNKYYDIKDFGLDTSYINYQKYVVFDLCDDKYSLSDLFNKEFNDQIVELRMNEHYIPSFGYILTVCSAMLFWIKFDTLDKFCLLNYTNINFNILLVFSCLILTMDQSVSNISELQDRLLNTLRWREYCGPATEECNSNVPLMFPITTWPPSYKRYLYYYYNVIKRVRNSDLYVAEAESLIEELESEEMNYVASKDNLKVAEIKAYRLDSVVLVNSLIPKHRIDIEIYQLNGNTGTYDITDLTSRSVTTDGYSSLSGSVEQMLTVRSVDSNAGKATVEQVLGKSPYGGKTPSADSSLSQGIVSPVTSGASRFCGTVNPTISGVNLKTRLATGHANRAAEIHAKATELQASSPLGADAEVSSGTSYATCSPGDLGPSYDSDNVVSPLNEWVNHRCRSYDSIMFRNCKCSYYNQGDSNEEVKLLSCPYNYTTKTMINAEYDDNVVYYFKKEHREGGNKERHKNGVEGSHGNRADGGYTSVYGKQGKKGAYSHESGSKGVSGGSQYDDGAEERDVVLTGDVTIVFVVDIKNLGRNHVASYSFNTSFVDGTVIELKKEDLDIWDKKCPILPNSRILINLTQLKKEVCEQLVSKESIGSEMVMESTTEEGWYIFSKGGNVMNFVVNHIKKVKLNELQQLLRLTKHKIETCLLALKLCKSFAEALTLLIQLKKPFHQNYFNQDEANEFYKEKFDEDLETPKKFDIIEYEIDESGESEKASRELEKIEEGQKGHDEQRSVTDELEGELEKRWDGEKEKVVEEDDKREGEELKGSEKEKKEEDAQVDEDPLDRLKSIRNFRLSERTPLLPSGDEGSLASDGEMLEGESSSSSSRSGMEVDREESSFVVRGDLVTSADEVQLRTSEGRGPSEGESMMHLLKSSDLSPGKAEDAILATKEDAILGTKEGAVEDKYGLLGREERTQLDPEKDRLSEEEAEKLFRGFKDEELVTILEYADEKKLTQASASEEDASKDKKSQLSRSELLSRLNDENLIKLLTYKEGYMAMRNLVDKEKLEEFEKRFAKGEDVESLFRGKSAVYAKVERVEREKPGLLQPVATASDGEGQGRKEDSKSSGSAESMALSSDGMSISDKSDLGGLPSPKEVLLTTRLDISLSPISKAAPAKSGPLLVPPLIMGKAPTDPPVKQKDTEKQEKPEAKQPTAKQAPKGKMPPKLGKKVPPIPKGPIKSVKRALPLGVKLHWKPLLPNKLNNTIFASFNDNLLRSNTTQSDLIDVTNIKKLFSRSSHATNSISTMNSRSMVEVQEAQSASKRKKTSTLIEVLDNKRAQNVLIILRFNSMDEYIRLLDDVNSLAILTPVLTYFSAVACEGGAGSLSSRTSSIGSMFGLSTGSFGSLASSETADTSGFAAGGGVAAAAPASHVVSSTGTASIINAPVNEKEIDEIKDNVNKLHLSYPSEHEIELLLRQFRDIERMLIEMLLRDRMWVKINLVKYYIDMEHQLLVIAQQLKLYNDAISEVKNSRLLPLILNIILQYGNFVNYGNINEGEKGFTLSSTIKLIDFKSSDNTLSSLHYLIINLYIKLLTSATSAEPSSAENTPSAGALETATTKQVGAPLPDPDDALGGNLLNIDKKLMNVLKAQKISSRGINETLQELSNQLLEIITLFDRSSAGTRASFNNDMSSLSAGAANSLNNTDRSSSSLSSSGSGADDKMNALIGMCKKRLNETNEHKDRIFAELKDVWYYLGEDFGASGPDKTELGAENELEKIFKILGELIMCIKKVFSDVKVKPAKYLIVLSKPEDQELFLKSFMDARSRTNYYKSLKR
nr:hypothetical protein MACL_00002823 [Theileria orientalis]